ncbi:MAG: chemotaxis protein CheA [Planctomycetes bacterium]|nr:chemotaxis protein CheA [Planctomycetota bacterium]
MRTVERDARGEALEGLSRLCRVGAETIETLVGNSQLESQAQLVAGHLAEVITFAERCVQAVADGIELGSVTAPTPLLLVDAEEERHFIETVGLFVTNALGTLNDLEEDLLSLETATDRLDETVAAIRRVVHTLKAEFGVLNLNAPQALCHQAETTIDACTENDAPLPVDLLLQLCDNLKQFVERLAQDVKAAFGDPEPMLLKLREVATAANQGGEAAAVDGTPIVLEVGGEFADSLPEFITEARSHLADAELAMVELSREPDNTDNIDLTFRAFHTIKGVAGFLNLTPLVELAHVAETLLDGARSLRFRMDAKDIDLVLAAGDMITQMIASLEGHGAPSVGQWRALISQLQGRSGRSEAQQPEASADRAQAPEPAAAPVPDAASTAAVRAPEPKAVPEPEPEPESPASVVRPQPPRTKEAPAAEAAVKSARVERTIKVSTTRLDMLVDMVGELVIAQSMVLQDPAIQRLDSQSLTRNIGQVGKITRDLQEAAMSLRMVTVKATFQKMARLVRDVAVKSGKRVALSIHGEDTELDRNVVEQISDPLVHMIRNAIDHGIEAPAARGAIGKDQEGSLSLSAYHQGGSIVIEIADDGRGIDRAAVIDKAISKGLLPADVNQQALTDSEVFNMIFMPGFSTAAQVTDLSGRGVGMDVVRRNIEALRGKIEIDSALGKGTTFRLRLPLTLAIIDGMIVRVGQSRYVVPTLSIEQSFCPAAEDVHVLVDRGECVDVRGSVLPIYRLKHVFAQRDGKEDLTAGILIVVEADGQRSCLFVDEIVGQQQVVIKSLGMPRDSVPGLSGGAIMTDGRVALILDVGTMVESVLSA